MLFIKYPEVNCGESHERENYCVRLLAVVKLKK